MKTNALELSFVDRVVTLRDPGATVSASTPCTSASAHEATCPVGSADFALRLGDLADTFTILGPFLFGVGIYAGPGDDVVAGGAGRDFVDAGPGDNRVTGGEGGDQLGGDSGRDSLEAGIGDEPCRPPSRNHRRTSTTAGKASTPSVMRAVGTSVTATLRGRGGGGAEGEGDVFTGVENLAGGSGDDRLTGDAGGNVLTGDPVQTGSTGARDRTTFRATGDGTRSAAAPGTTRSSAKAPREMRIASSAAQASTRSSPPTPPTCSAGTANGSTSASL